MSNPHILRFGSSVELAQAAAAAWLKELSTRTKLNDNYCVALSGGRIAQEFFRGVVETAKTSQTSFQNVHFFWADERCVPPTDGESNFRLANELLLKPLNISAAQIHRLIGEAAPKTAAVQAAKELCNPASLNEDGFPILDMIFLGLGEDGHVASLFPNENLNPSTDESIYRAIFDSPKPPANRITLGYTVIAQARQVWVLAAGQGKKAALLDSLKQNGQTPFARILQHRGDIKIFTDIS